MRAGLFAGLIHRSQASAGSANVLLLEDGTPLLLEDGSFLLLEP